MHLLHPQWLSLRAYASVSRGGPSRLGPTISLDHVGLHFPVPSPTDAKASSSNVVELYLCGARSYEDVDGYLNPINARRHLDLRGRSSRGRGMLRILYALWIDTSWGRGGVKRHADK